VRSSSGAVLPGASLVLRSAGSEREAPRELDSSLTTDREGLASIDPELLSELADDEHAELLVQAEGFGAVLVNEEALLSALGHDAPYPVELAPLSRFTLVSQCPPNLGRQLIMGWFRDDGLELERQYADCPPHTEPLELEVDAPRGRVHFVALWFDEHAPQLALRTLELDSEPVGDAARVELPLRPHALSLRLLQVVDRRDRPIPELEVIAANQLGRDAQLERWLNEVTTYTDAEGHFEWLSQRSYAPQLLLAPPAPRPRVSHTLRQGEEQIRLDHMAMVHCLMRGPTGEPASFGGFGYEVSPRDGEPYGSFTSGSGDSDPAGQVAFLWPEDAVRVEVSSPGFEPVEIHTADAPCVLKRR
jgi:hypothetical protein